MMRALYTAVSGLKNHQTRMDSIGNNIANVNTTGYKSSRVTFADTLSQTLSGSSSPNGNVGGINAQQIGLGMAVSSIDTNFTHGSASSTGNNTDLAIDTDAGLFIVKNGDQTYYTRNGNFTLDNDGNLVMNGSGLHVQGWNGENGSVNANGLPENIKIDKDSAMSPKTTTTATFSGNLSADDISQAITAIKVNYADGTSESVDGSYASKSLTKASLVGASGTKYTILDANGGSINPDGYYVGNLIDQTDKLTSITATGDPITINFDTSGGTGSKGGTITGYPDTVSDITSGIYEKNKDGKIDLGTITEIKPINSTDFTIITNKGTFTITDPPSSDTYKVGDNVSVQAKVTGGKTNPGSASILTFVKEGGSINTINTADIPSALGSSYRFGDAAIQSITATGEPITITYAESGTGSNGATITGYPTTAIETSGTYEIGKDVPIELGTIKTGGIEKISDTEYHITTDKGTYTVTYDTPPSDPYEEGNTVLVQAAVKSGATNGSAATLTFADGVSINTGDMPPSDLSSYELGGSVPVKIDVAASDQLSGGISVVNSYNGKEVQGLTLTMKDGSAQTGFADDTYSEGQDAYAVHTSTVTIYDNLGASHTVPVYIQKNDADKWVVKVQGGTYDGAQVASSEQELEFDGANGTLISGGSMNINLSVPYPNGAMLNEKVAADFGQLTQYSGGNTATASTDGYAAGFYKDMSIGQDGVITLTYTNGQKQEGGQLAIATFNNEAGLEKAGGSLYSASNNSGEAKVGTFASQGVSVTPGALEMSNVDISNEFSDMIVTQRGFQANSKIITVADEMLETLVNMKR
ncbi:flagellar hook-basal body complex protein [Pectinatus cerevisiiphilus]|uniref:Flagellar hook protein FlgE n=1 Tax=Pectinatus cerevisiiphilus TaxID=86956 RepID=A0A4R3KD14_9FIRM|nr:flagellar hook-basal body complex protein [Pectinatus cerevisiiphilus]TCS80950.1 flagellar hook-basal body protein [Pectinatus cerevisiiphilus]